MVTLYQSPGSRSLRPLWLLEELGQPYQLETVGFPPRLKSPEFLNINSLGTVPYLVDGDLRMDESCAMLTYLSERYGGGQFQVSAQQSNYGGYLNWLHFGEASLSYPQAVALRYRFFLPKEQRLPSVAEHYQQLVEERVAMVSQAVTDSDYICGDGFTLADISVGYGLFLTRMFKLDGNFDSNVNGYCERLFSRQGFKRALQAQSIQ